jgi:putrescine aminotransferase
MGFESVEVSAEGCLVHTADGRDYIDCLGGPGVFTMGHRHPKIVEAVHRQLHKMPLSSHLLLNPVTAELAERVAEIAPGGLQFSFFGNSGAEAVEGALKAARMHTGKPGVVAALGGFHGKTFGALSASGREVYRAPFEPLVPGFRHVDFGDADAVAEALDPDTAAVILEPIQCENGVRVPPEGYLRAVREACDRAGVLLILDEVQTGLGRTGRMFAGDHEGVAPDILCLGKALGGGVMPIGAFVATPQVWEIFRDNPIIHTSTFGGNPLACAAALAALDVIEEEGLVERARELGRLLLARAQEVVTAFPEVVVEARGRGLLVGVEMVDPDIGGLVIAGLAQRGVLCAYTLNNPKVLRFEPPAVIAEGQIEAVMQALHESVAQAVEIVQQAGIEFST